MRWQRHLRLVIFMICLCCHSAAFAFVPSDNRTIAQQDAVNAALEGLIANQDWEGAQNVVERYLDSLIHNPRFFEIAIFIYETRGAFDKARLLADIASQLYPDYAPFLGRYAFLLAREGQCQRADTAWAHYRQIHYFPIRQADQAYFANYCGTEIVQKAGITGTVAREERFASPFGKSEITAQKGSQLHQLCTLLAGLCAEGEVFYITSPPPPRNTLILRYHGDTYRRYHWRHAAQIGFALNQHIGGYRKYSGHLYASWDYRISPTRAMATRIGFEHAVIPAFQDDGVHYTQTPYLQWHVQEQITLKVRTNLSLRHAAQTAASSGQYRTTHQTGFHNGVSIAATLAHEIGLYVSGNKTMPPHDDIYGDQLRLGYGLRYRYDAAHDVQMSLGFERSHTRFEKTLPFLRQPHRIVEKSAFIQLSKSFERLDGMIPFVRVTKTARQSDNPRQQGQQEIITAGLSFRL